MTSSSVHKSIFAVAARCACCFTVLPSLHIISSARRSETIKKFSSSRSPFEKCRIYDFFTLSPPRLFQGDGVWVTNNGKRVQLRDVFLPSLTEVERLVLEKQAQEKILQLGITLSPPGEIK